jgi:8-oxo-dGTP diphosphatase
VALVHRPRYDDWTLAKGKAKAGESLAVTAVREVREETGATIRLGPPLSALRYHSAARSHHAGSRSGRETLKRVAWWKGEILRLDEPTASAKEIDDVVWLPLDQAVERLTYVDERGLVDEALAWPLTGPLLLVRHAQAVARKEWSGVDRDRPLDASGQAQLPWLHRLLGAYGVADLVTSPARRCVETVAGYAAADRLTRVEILSQEAGEADPAGLGEFIQALSRTVALSRPTAVCLHRPLLPTVLASLGLPARPLDPAAAVVVHCDAAGRPVATEWVDPARGDVRK